MGGRCDGGDIGGISKYGTENVGNSIILLQHLSAKVHPGESTVKSKGQTLCAHEEARKGDKRKCTGMESKSVGLRNECRWREGAEVNAPQNLIQTERVGRLLGWNKRNIWMKRRLRRTGRSPRSLAPSVRKWQRGEPAETFPFVAFKNGDPLRRDALREAASNLPKDAKGCSGAL